MTTEARAVVAMFNTLSTEEQLQVVSALARNNGGILQKGLNLGPAPLRDGEEGGVRQPNAGVNVGPAPALNRMMRPGTRVCQGCGRPM